MGGNCSAPASRAFARRLSLTINISRSKGNQSFVGPHSQNAERGGPAAPRVSRPMLGRGAHCIALAAQWEAKARTQDNSLPPSLLKNTAFHPFRASFFTQASGERAESCLDAGRGVRRAGRERRAARRSKAVVCAELFEMPRNLRRRISPSSSSSRPENDLKNCIFEQRTSH